MGKNSKRLLLSCKYYNAVSEKHDKWANIKIKALGIWYLAWEYLASQGDIGILKMPSCLRNSYDWKYV